MTGAIVHRDCVPVAAIGVRDELRPNFVRTQTAHGVGITMLTGDNARNAGRDRRHPRRAALGGQGRRDR